MCGLSRIPHLGIHTRLSAIRNRAGPCVRKCSAHGKHKPRPVIKYGAESEKWSKHVECCRVVYDSLLIFYSDCSTVTLILSHATEVVCKDV